MEEFYAEPHFSVPSILTRASVPGLAARDQRNIPQKMHHTSIAVRREMDVAKEPVVVVGFYTFFLPREHEFSLLR